MLYVEVYNQFTSEKVNYCYLDYKDMRRGVIDTTITPTICATYTLKHHKITHVHPAYCTQGSGFFSIVWKK